MDNENNVFIVNKQELIQAALEMEKQETLLSLMLFTCIDQLEDIRRKLDAVMTQNESNVARGAFLNLLMTNEEWGKIITDELLKQWEADASETTKQEGMAFFQRQH